jgi:hypothetical protein
MVIILRISSRVHAGVSGVGWGLTKRRKIAKTLVLNTGCRHSLNLARLELDSPSINAQVDVFHTDHPVSFGLSFYLPFLLFGQGPIQAEI